MAVLGQCPIWVYRHAAQYLCDDAGWLLAFTTPGKALACLGQRPLWQCQVIAPHQMVFLLADLHEVESPGIRLNPSSVSSGFGPRYALDALVQAHVPQRLSV